jgi:hypothetical protein
MSGDNVNDQQKNKQVNQNELIAEAEKVRELTKAGGEFTREMVAEGKKILDQTPENQLR